MKSEFDTFTMPLIYTPGDNEWTDCHRENNGSYDPLDRLALIRETYFAKPGTTLGSGTMTVSSQAAYGIPENVRWSAERIQYAAVHVVGSNDGTQPWSGLGRTEQTPEQRAAQKASMANAVQVVQQAFADARHQRDRAVVLFLQADMFDPSDPKPATENYDAFTPLVQTLIDESARFRGEVYLFDGDSHIFTVDRPLAAGSAWLTLYGVHGSADRLTRITVDGSANNDNYLAVSVNPGRDRVLSWKQVLYTDPAN